MSELKDSSVARTAGRGVIYIAFAKLYFMVAGAVIEFRLPAILSNTVFGAYAVVSSWVSPINNVLITGTIQSVSRFTAQKPEQARAIQGAGLLMHLYIGLPVALGFIVLAPVVSMLIRDQTKVGPLMLAGLIIAGYSFYAVFVGTANGRKEFHKQAMLDVCFATLRAGAILGLALAGFGLYGAISGWVAAVAAILVIASFVVGRPVGPRARVRPLAGFFASVAIYLVLMNFIMFVDQLLLKPLATIWFEAHSVVESGVLAQVAPEWLVAALDGRVTPSRAADTQVGYYRAVQNLARLAYQAIIAGTFVIFPLVSRSTFENDADATKSYVETTVRYSMIFAASIATVFAANPLELLDIPYAADYAQTGAQALVVLAAGNVAFSLFVICGTILNGAGRTREAILLAAATLIAATVGNALVIPRLEPGAELLLGCATATSTAMVLGAGGGLVIVRSRFSAALPWATLVRVLIAAGVAVAVGRAIPTSSAALVMAESAVIGVVFFAILLITREIQRADLRRLRNISRGKRQ